MKATVKLTENITLEIDEKDEKDTLNKAITFGRLPGRCNVCGNTQSFKLASNKDKEGNVYVKIRCTAKNKDGNWCGASAKLGEYKAGGFFWHDFEEYIPKNQDAKSAPPKSAPRPASKAVEPPDPVDEGPQPDQDIPF